MNRLRTIFRKELLAIMLVLILSSCDTESDFVKYSGHSFVQFSDSVAELPFMNDMDVQEVYISASQTVDYDRNFGVSVVPKESSAIEGYQFDLESHTVTIKAGEHTAPVRIVGYIAELDESIDTTYVTLTLINQDEDPNLGGNDIKVTLTKVCPFNIDDFIGHCVVRSGFFDYYATTAMRLTSSIADPEDSLGIIVKDFFQDGYDLKFRFNTENVLEPYLEMGEDQVVAEGSTYFNYIYDDDKLNITQPAAYPSAYNACGGFTVMYNAFYFRTAGTVGIFRSTIEWITDAEADYYEKLGY
ncbi:MAG: DUF4984 domain-containing protein [Mangrovibacterium sp.]